MKKITLYLVGMLMGGMLISYTAYSQLANEGEQVVEAKDQLSEQLKIFPNPTNGKFQFTLEYDGTEKVIAKIYDITGKLITDISEDLETGESFITADVDLDSPRSGVFFLRTRIGSSILTKKIIVR